MKIIEFCWFIRILYGIANVRWNSRLVWNRSDSVSIRFEQLVKLAKQTNSSYPEQVSPLVIGPVKSNELTDCHIRFKLSVMRMIPFLFLLVYSYLYSKNIRIVPPNWPDTSSNGASWSNIFSRSIFIKYYTFVSQESSP